MGGNYVFINRTRCHVIDACSPLNSTQCKLIKTKSEMENKIVENEQKYYLGTLGHAVLLTERASNAIVK